MELFCSCSCFSNLLWDMLFIKFDIIEFLKIRIEPFVLLFSLFNCLGTCMEKLNKLRLKLLNSYKTDFPTLKLVINCKYTACYMFLLVHTSNFKL